MSFVEEVLTSIM